MLGKKGGDRLLCSQPRSDAELLCVTLNDQGEEKEEQKSLGKIKDRYSWQGSAEVRKA